MMIEALPGRGVVASGGETMVDLQQSRWFLGPLNELFVVYRMWPEFPWNRGIELT